jgi:hypothetical protein
MHARPFVALRRIANEKAPCLARSDAGTYAARVTPAYLDEVIDQVARTARVVATRSRIARRGVGVALYRARGVYAASVIDEGLGIAAEVPAKDL